MRDQVGGHRAGSDQWLRGAADQARRVFPAFAVAIMAMLAILAVLFAFAKVKGEPLQVLTRDPAAITETPPYYGIVTFAGVTAWAAAAAFCLLGAALLGRDPAHRRMWWFLVAGFALSATLLADDALMLHESVLPALGIPEMLVYVGYLGSIAAFLVFFRAEIFRTDYLLLLAALAAMGTSIGLDIVLEFGDLSSFLEDGAKFAGTVLWALYFARTAMHAVRVHLGTSGHVPAPRRAPATDDTVILPRTDASP